MLKSKFNLRLHITMVIIRQTCLPKNLNPQGCQGPQEENWLRTVGWPCATLALKHVANRLEDYHICHKILKKHSYTIWYKVYHSTETHTEPSHSILGQQLDIMVWNICFSSCIPLDYYCDWHYLYTVDTGHIWGEPPSLGHVLRWRYHLQLWSYSGENHPHLDLPNQAINWHLWSYSGETLALRNGIPSHHKSQNCQPI